MKSRAVRRGSTLLAALAIIAILALIIFGVLTYTGAEQERGGRSVRDIDAQTCVESAAQWGRKFYGDRYMTPEGFGWKSLLAVNSGYTNPEEKDPNKWGEGSFGRLDGKTVSTQFPADFRVTIRDNADEFPADKSQPTVDSDLQIILRAECLIPRLALRNYDVVESPSAAGDDPYKWHGRVLSESSDTRRNKVIEMVITLVPGGCYVGVAGGGCTGDRYISY